MPSGSHGGSSGSHGGFSGGGSFGGGGSSFRGGRSYNHRPRGPRYIRWFGGRTLIISTGRQNLLWLIVIGVIFIGMIALASFTTVKQTKNSLAMIEEEQRYYLSMVADAEADPSLQTTGKVTGVFYKTEYEKYYITYDLYSASGTAYEGYSFSIYTLETAPKKGTEILLAVDDSTIDATTDSIPMDYKNYTLEDDGEYLFLKGRYKYNRNLLIGMVVVAVALVGGAIIVIATAKKKKEEKEEAEKQAEVEKQEELERRRYCQYCGSKVDEADNVCSQCGGKLL